MGKRNRNKRKVLDNETQTAAASSLTSSLSSKKASVALSTNPNPLLQQQASFLNKLTPTERSEFFSNKLMDPVRRGVLWMEQADLGEDLLNQYSWATPDDRAIRILKYFSPIIEIGCGCQAYWCSLMKNAGVDVIGYDNDPERGGTIGKEKVSKSQVLHFHERRGGPEVLALPEHAQRSLFLCYPDENEDSETEKKETGELHSGSSLALSCLEHYRGDHVIHVGELFTDTTLAVEQAPWGRSSSPEFQQQIASEFHCLLRVSLPSWLHVRDTLSVWKRSETCPIVFGDGDQDDDDDEEILYRHIPEEERLPTDVAASCLAHLLQEPEGAVNPEKEPMRSTEKQPTKSKVNHSSSKKSKKQEPKRAKTSQAETYSTPW